MGKKNYESASDNWNVADSYSKIKIMKLLGEIDEYIKIAKTGVSELSDEFVIGQQIKINARILALRRLHMTIEMLINNSLFGVKKKDKDVLKEWLKALKSINLGKTHNLIQNKDKQTSQSIREHEFEIVLNILIDIHREILTPLDDANMIYPGGEEEWDQEFSLI